MGSESALSAAGATRAPVAAGTASWTVLVYMAADNDLEAAALDDLQEIARVGSSDKLKIAVQLDRISSLASWGSTANGEWASTKRLLITPGMDLEDWSSAEDLGELNTGDPGTLADFITWGVTSYPAERYALIIWSHGAAWQGLARDNTSGEDNLTLPELDQALVMAAERSSYATLDLIGLDACLMAQLDVLQTIAPYARVAVASAEFEPTRGWAWDAWLEALTTNPNRDAFSVADTIVVSYASSYQGTSTRDMTLAAFDLARVSQITDQLARLTEAMLHEGRSAYTALAQARSRVDFYASARADEFSAVDLGQLAQLLAGHGPTGEAAADLARSIEQARLAYGAGPAHHDVSGLSIYFPPRAELYLADYERDSTLPRLTRWADLLKVYHRVTAAEARSSP